MRWMSVPWHDCLCYGKAKEGAERKGAFGGWRDGVLCSGVS